MCELCNKFKLDAPFKFHRPDEFTKGILVGTNAKKYLDFFENKVYPYAMEKPSMTVVVGQPGAGKTQLLNYLESTWKEKNRIFVLLNLKDTKVSYDYLVEAVINSDSFHYFLYSNGITLDPTKSATEKVDEIKEIIREVREKQMDNNFGICLLMDTVDEYLRKINSINGEKEDVQNEIAKDLIKITGQLLNDLSYSCAVFAITEDVNNKFEKVLEEDISLKSRFYSVSNYTDVDKSYEYYKLEKLDENETEEMIAAFLEIWAKRNDISLPTQYKETITPSGLNLFPFSRKAINLFWNAGAIPGDTCLACLIALDRKLNLLSSNSSDYSHLIVNEIDAAWIVYKFSSYFYYERELKNQIENLLEGEQLDCEINKITNKAKSTYFDFSNALPKSFKVYLEAFSYDFSISQSNVRKFIKDKNATDKDFETIDLVVDFKGRKIGVQFAVKFDNKIDTCRNLQKKTEILFSALKNDAIERGLLILISDNELEKTNVYNSLRKRYKDNKCSKDMEKDKDNYILKKYFPTFMVHRISADYAWCLLGLNVFIADNDINAMKKYSRYIDSKIRMGPLFEQILERNADITYMPKTKMISTAEILDRSN